MKYRQSKKLIQKISYYYKKREDSSANQDLALLVFRSQVRSRLRFSPLILITEILQEGNL